MRVIMIRPWSQKQQKAFGACIEILANGFIEVVEAALNEANEEFFMAACSMAFSTFDINAPTSTVAASAKARLCRI